MSNRALAAQAHMVVWNKKKKMVFRAKRRKKTHGNKRKHSILS
jgi:hypothetical protein